MKNQNKKQKIFILFVSFLVITLSGCGQGNSKHTPVTTPTSSPENITTTPKEAEPNFIGTNQETLPEDNRQELSNIEESEPTSTTDLIVHFGDSGSSFVMHLYNNDTATAIAKHVGTADWRLPIYHYNDYDNWEIMQYYDIPSRYEIPSNAESITSEVAGTVYYSEPNRIILFYHDAEISGEYTPVGYFDYTEEFVKAVEENPVLEGWGNKIVQISANK